MREETRETISLNQALDRHPFISPQECAEQGVVFYITHAVKDDMNEYEGKPAPRYIFTIEDTEGEKYSLALGQTTVRDQVANAVADYIVGPMRLEMGERRAWKFTEITPEADGKVPAKKPAPKRPKEEIPF